MSYRSLVASTITSLGTLALALMLGWTDANAQMPAPGNSAADSIAPEIIAPVTPPAPFTGRGIGTINVTSSCSLVTCNGGDSCFCYDFSSIPVVVSGLGKVTLTGEISVDSITLQRDGTGGFCEASGGVGTLTRANGDQINLKLGGQNCVYNGNAGGQFGEFGTYYITGGTGKLSTKTGTGTFSFFGPFVFGSATTPISMLGVIK